MHTWFRQSHDVGHVWHEDAAFEDEFGSAALVDEFALGEDVFGFGNVDFFGAD